MMRSPAGLRLARDLTQVVYCQCRRIDDQGSGSMLQRLVIGRRWNPMPVVVTRAGPGCEVGRVGLEQLGIYEDVRLHIHLAQVGEDCRLEGLGESVYYRPDIWTGRIGDQVWKCRILDTDPSHVPY